MFGHSNHRGRRHRRHHVAQVSSLLGRVEAEAAPPTAAAEALVPLRAAAGELLGSLQPENLPFFAELITGCVLQVWV